MRAHGFESWLANVYARGVRRAQKGPQQRRERVDRHGLSGGETVAPTPRTLHLNSHIITIERREGRRGEEEADKTETYKEVF